MDTLIEHLDFREILRKYDSDVTFMYIDPPYLPSTRKGGKYEEEMTHEDHVDMIELLRTTKARVMLSGYPNELYESLGWHKIQYDVYIHCTPTRKSLRHEIVWMNYDPDSCNQMQHGAADIN